jgi:hypothetical protein
MNPAYRYGQMLAKEAVVASLGSVWDRLRQPPSPPDPRRYPALAYTQARVAQGGPNYSSFDQLPLHQR